MPLLPNQHNSRNLPPIIGFAGMGGAAEAEKAVFGRIGANTQRFDRFYPSRGQAVGGIARQIEAIMTLLAGGDEETALPKTQFQKAVAELPAHFVIVLGNTGPDRGADAIAPGPQFFHG